MAADVVIASDEHVGAVVTSGTMDAGESEGACALVLEHVHASR